LTHPGNVAIAQRRRRQGCGKDVSDLVAETLAASPQPMSAYQVLDRLRGQGLRSPPTIYRALDRLIKEGRAHRLESLNAFVACAHGPHCQRAAFAICRQCGHVEEFSLESDLSCERRAEGRLFLIERAVIEMMGLCGSCRSTAPIQ
jgi:Fur family zinc uptake transcriptional regulator